MRIIHHAKAQRYHKRQWVQRHKNYGAGKFPLPIKLNDLRREFLLADVNSALGEYEQNEEIAPIVKEIREKVKKDELKSKDEIYTWLDEQRKKNENKNYGGSWFTEGKIIEEKPYGKHILIQDKVGKKYSTKNIAPIGSRTIFPGEMIHGKDKKPDLIVDYEVL